jgi:adenine-specific DNA methylase
MIQQASFALRSRNPDVLTCIANLSNDEVFTPPEFANRMLDTLAEAWAANNKGANIWADKTVKFLDPCTKSGVFLREITSRLNKGLEPEIPDLQKRVEHILTRQVFGIGITQITSLLARRSVYCSKHATGKHSIAKSFTGDDGNIWFKRLKHTWDGDKCQYCGAGKSVFNRAAGLETHAYAFIHTDNIKTRLAEIFGGNMQFDVIIGNPPYQMKGGAGGSSDSSSVPRYHTQFIAISGIVEFRSNYPSKLPTTTTKRGIDASSSLYLQVKNKMREGMLIFTDYTNKWKGRANESKKHMEEATALSLEEIKTEAKTLSFSPTKRSALPGSQYRPDLPLPRRLESRTRRISYVKDVDEVKRVAEYLFDDANADPSDVGEKCFDLMLKETRK